MHICVVTVISHPGFHGRNQLNLDLMAGNNSEQILQNIKNLFSTKTHEFHV